MKVRLPSSGECDVVVRYSRDENNRPVYTDVTVWQKDSEGEICIGFGESHCHSKDECRKSLGRAYALKNMIKAFAGNFTKEDRTVLFALVCPKFFSPKKVLTLFNRCRPGYDYLVENLEKPTY